MKKNLFLIIITLITVLCIIIGASRHLGVPRKSYSSLASSIRKGFRSGRLHFNFNDDDEDEMEDFDFDDEDPKSFDSEVISEFKELEVELKVGSLKIERGSKWEIQSKYSYSYLKPEYTLKNGKLVITQSGYKNQHVGNKNCNVVITVPFGTALDKVMYTLLADTVLFSYLCKGHILINSSFIYTFLMFGKKLAVKIIQQALLYDFFHISPFSYKDTMIIIDKKNMGVKYFFLTP